MGKVFTLGLMLLALGAGLMVVGFISPPEEPLGLLRWLGVASAAIGIIILGVVLFTEKR